MSAIDRNARASSQFEIRLSQTQALLRQAASGHAAPNAGAEPRVTQASSLGAEDVVITHLINALALPIPVFVLDTGALHSQTLALLATTQRESRAPVQVLRPQPHAVAQFVAREGENAIFKSVTLRKACCQIRKLEPLERALEGKTAWITGLRREQSGTRSEVPLVDFSNSERVKYNPLAHWTWGDVWHYIAEHKVPYNPLHDQFYPSIGCAPCTRAISLGEDFRAGRWWWEDESAKECGLHLEQPDDLQNRQEAIAP